MGGSIEAFRAFYGRDPKDPSKRIEKNRKPTATPSTEDPTATAPPAVRSTTPPIQADHTETNLEDVNSDDNSSNGITSHILNGANALQESISNSLPTSGVLTDIETLLPEPNATHSAEHVARSAERMQRNTNEQLIERSAVLSKLAGQGNGSGIGMVADAEAGTALNEIVTEQNGLRERSENDSSL